jgi:hypothetical protein
MNVASLVELKPRVTAIIAAMTSTNRPAMLEGYQRLARLIDNLASLPANTKIDHIQTLTFLIEDEEDVIKKGFGSVYTTPDMEGSSIKMLHVAVDDLDLLIG